MQATGLASSLREGNYRTALPVTLVFTGAAFSHSWGVFPLEVANRRQAFWGESQYRMALTSLAEMHAAWWGRPSGASVESWEPYGTGYLVEEAQTALLQIATAPWGERFLTGKQVREWLRALQNPDAMLAGLADMPRTLIHSDRWTSDMEQPVYDWRQLAIGPAPYDVACFFSASRLWFGRLPLGRIEMRNWYLQRLNERLGTERLDRYTFDMGFDAGMALRFTLRWPSFIVKHHATLLATATHLRATVIEPAWASLRRCS